MTLRAILERLFSYMATASIPPIVTLAFSGGKLNWNIISRQYIASLVFTIAIAVPLEIVLRRMVPHMRHRRRLVRMPAYGLAMAAVAVTGTLVGSSVLCAAGLVPWRAYWNLFGGAVKVSLLLTFLFGIGELAAGMMQARLNEANEALQRKEEEERRARELATEARLMSLESRVHPHFLFNAINSILSLIREDPARAEYLLERMAALLRFSLDQSQGRFVPVERELRIVRDYLEIEKARFGDRLRFEIQAAPGLDAEVPPLSIQTLVENSVKYAVSPRREGGTIQVHAFAREGQAVIEVTDDGPGFDDSSVGNGHGLSLVKERLGTLELDRQPGAMTVRTRVPLGVRA